VTASGARGGCRLFFRWFVGSKILLYHDSLLFFQVSPVFHVLKDAVRKMILAYKQEKSKKEVLPAR
jgi:hypothetical protein